MNPPIRSNLKDVRKQVLARRWVQETEAFLNTRIRNPEIGRDGRANPRLELTSSQSPADQPQASPETPPNPGGEDDER